VKATYELFDHTADMGIRVTAPTMADLIRPAGEALYAVIGQLAVGPGSPGRPVNWRLTGAEPVVLLRDYLAELLTLFERDHQIVIEPVVEEFDASRLVVAAQALQLDEDRSAFQREVKAVTYHALEIVPIPGGYRATIIVDI
jgi:SHS2 domain-containing protein